MTSVAILGKRGSGKTTVAEQFTERLGYARHSWAQPVKQIAAMAYGPVDKAATYEVTRGDEQVQVSGRWLLQRIGTDAIRRVIDEDFWIKAGARVLDSVEDNTNWVNDDTRFPNEVSSLRARGFLVVYLDVPVFVRRARLAEAFDAEAETHPSETSVGAGDADVVIQVSPEMTALDVYTQCAAALPNSREGS